MNSIVLDTLYNVKNCDAKNITPIVIDYTRYTFLEETFRELSSKRFFTTKQEDVNGYVHEDLILQIIDQPEVVTNSRRFKKILYDLLYSHISSDRKFYSPVLQVLTKHLRAPVANQSHKWLALYSYEDFHTIVKQFIPDTTNEDIDKLYDDCDHLMRSFVVNV